MADQPRSLDRSRLGDGPLATLSPEELAELERALLGAMGIGLDTDHCHQLDVDFDEQE